MYKRRPPTPRERTMNIVASIRSYKTSIIGVLLPTIGFLALKGVIDAETAAFLISVLGGLGFLASKDGDKASEHVGISTTKTSGGHLFLIPLLLCLTLGMAGCSSLGFVSVVEVERIRDTVQPDHMLRVRADGNGMRTESWGFFWQGVDDTIKSAKQPSP